MQSRTILFVYAQQAEASEFVAVIGSDAQYLAPERYALSSPSNSAGESNRYMMFMHYTTDRATKWSWVFDV